MSTTVRIAVVGLGTHGRGIVRVAREAGVEIAGAVDPFHSGRELGDLVEAPLPAPLTVAPDVDDLDWTGTDLAVVAVKLEPEAVVALIERILVHGVDVITIVEDLYDLDAYAPALRVRLDDAARRAGRTVIATGGQDVGWGGLALQATAVVRDLKALRIATHAGVDGYPEEFLAWCGIGIGHEEWPAAADVAAETPSVFGAILPVLARKIGLTPIKETREFEKVVFDEPFASITYGRDIPAGDPAGRIDRVIVHTEEGVELTAELRTDPQLGDDHYTLEIDAYPKVSLRHVIDPGGASVDAIVVNRIPDVLEAPPGFVPTVDLPTPRFRPHVERAPASEL